jgi:FXSXX-COOH protein
MADPLADSSTPLPDLANERIVNILTSNESALATAVRRVVRESTAAAGYYAAFGNAPAPLTEA